MTVTRREFGSLAAALGAALAFPSRSHARTKWREQRGAFPQGVASGDPDTNSVILWTRREPEAGAKSYKLTVEVASDERFGRIVARGTTQVGAGRAECRRGAR